MEFRLDRDAEALRWGPPCRRCDDLTEIVPLGVDRTDEETETATPADEPLATVDSFTWPPAPDPEVRPPIGAAHADRDVRSARRRSRLPGPLLRAAEFWYAWRASRRLRYMYDVVQEQQPVQTNTERYEEVVAWWTGLDRHGARTVLRRAEQSFTDWVSERDLRFRDLVLYLVTADYIRVYPERHGTRSRMARTIARVIPRTL